MTHAHTHSAPTCSGAKVEGVSAGARRVEQQVAVGGPVHANGQVLAIHCGVHGDVGGISAVQ